MKLYSPALAAPHVDDLGCGKIKLRLQCQVSAATTTIRKRLTRNCRLITVSHEFLFSAIFLTIPPPATRRGCLRSSLSAKDFRGGLSNQFVHSRRHRGIVAWSAREGLSDPKDNAHMVRCAVIGQRDRRAACERGAI